MKLWLIVNGNLKSAKFDDIYTMLKSAFEDRGDEIEVVKNTELIFEDEKFIGNMSLPKVALFWDKDIFLGERLEAMGVKLINSALSTENCDNKYKTYEILKKAGVPQPKTILCPFTYKNIGYGQEAENITQKAVEALGLPLIIKECRGSFGQQVYKADTKNEAVGILTKLSEPVIFQEFIEESSGRDMRINIVGQDIVASMIRQSKDDFRANVTLGGKTFKYEPTEEERAVALKAAEALGLEIGGVDILFSNKGPLVCEVNSNAHFRSIYECTGVDMAEKIAKYIGEKYG
ncbi:MAG: RimK family alpha-L-glutamate ligase [Firmicutes bacterium]|nr:RimK family alpha-L-glutamate ligase [Bacillota bacterium]